MTKIASLLFGALLFAMSLLALSTEASAQRRCGDFIQNGTIYVASRARDCDRGTAWKRDSHGHRHWGAAQIHGRAYYKPTRSLPPKRTDLFPQRTAAQSLAPSVGGQTGTAGNCPAGKTVGEPYQCPTSRTGMCICQ